jgi:hypothetical protein
MRKEENLGMCGCYLLIFIFNLILGGWSVNYLLLWLAEKTIPFFWATVIGLFVGEFSIPVAVVVAILRWFGVL